MQRKTWSTVGDCWMTFNDDVNDDAEGGDRIMAMKQVKIMVSGW